MKDERMDVRLMVEWGRTKKRRSVSHVTKVKFWLLETDPGTRVPRTLTVLTRGGS